MMLQSTSDVCKLLSIATILFTIVAKSQTDDEIPVCDHCEANPNKCSDLHTWYLAGSIFTMIGSLFVICTYMTIQVKCRVTQ